MSRRRTCPLEPQASSVYRELAMVHYTPRSIACPAERACARCTPLVAELDALAARCEARGCSTTGCVLDPPRSHHAYVKQRPGIARMRSAYRAKRGRR